MGSIYPSKVRANNINDEQDQFAFEYSETLSSPGNGTWIEFPNGVDGASVELVISSGTGKVQATSDSLSRVQAGSAEGVDWDLGVVSGTTQDYCAPVTAIRAVNVSGTIKINVRMQ